MVAATLPVNQETVNFLVEAYNKKHQEVINLQEELLQTLDEVKLAHYQALEMEELFGESLEVDSKYLGVDVLMYLTIQKLPHALRVLEKKGKEVIIRDFYQELNRVLISDLSYPLAGAIENEEAVFQDRLTTTVRHTIEYIKTLKFQPRNNHLAERLQILVFNYIFPTKLCVGELKDLALKKATATEIKGQLCAMFSGVFESICVIREKHFFKKQGVHAETWQIILSRGVLSSMGEGSKQLIKTSLGNTDQSAEPCTAKPYDTEVIDDMFESGNRAKERIEKGVVEAAKVAKVYQNIILYISCDGNIKDTVIIKPNRTISIFSGVGLYFQFVMRLIFNPSWLASFLGRPLLPGSEPQASIEKGASSQQV